MKDATYIAEVHDNGWLDCEHGQKSFHTNTTFCLLLDQISAPSASAAHAAATSRELSDQLISARAYTIT